MWLRIWEGENTTLAAIEGYLVSSRFSKVTANNLSEAGISKNS